MKSILKFSNIIRYEPCITNQQAELAIATANCQIAQATAIKMKGFVDYQKQFFLLGLRRPNVDRAITENAWDYTHIKAALGVRASLLGSPNGEPVSLQFLQFTSHLIELII